MPLNIELKLEVWDSPNSAGIIIDAVRSPRGRGNEANDREERRRERPQQNN